MHLKVQHGIQSQVPRHQLVATRYAVMVTAAILFASISTVGMADEVHETLTSPFTDIVFDSVSSDVAVTGSESAVPTPLPGTAADDPMLAYLKDRVTKDPTHSDSWRLIGRLERKRGDIPAAIAAVQHSLELDPNNAASHFDLAEIQEVMGDATSAASHFQSVTEIAPDSQYAQTLYESGKVNRPAASVGSNQLLSDVEQVRYEIQTFDGSDDLATRFNELESDADLELQSLRLFLETGLFYNTNVTLTPISRELANSDAASFQFFASPDVEWIALRRGMWRSGTLARGYFTVNESGFSAFDLASFQPGAFLERDLSWNGSELIGRLEYLYSLDLLDGLRFADRHSLTASMITIRPDLDVIYSYIRASFSEFKNDGDDPVVTSLDGNSISAGVSRFFQTKVVWMPTYTLGVDLEAASTEGSDYRYRAVTGFTDVTFVISPRWSFVPSAGIGYRDYFAFTGPVSRDELTWRINGKLKFQMTERIAIAAIVGHDRFASKNELFDAQRTQGGVVTTIVY